MFVDAATARSRTSLVHRTPFRSKCATSTPSFLIRWDTYRRVELCGSTPNDSNASDNDRAPRAASSSRSLVYALAPTKHPSVPDHPFVVSHGVTNRLSDGHARKTERLVPDLTGTSRSQTRSAGSQTPRSLMILATWPVALTLYRARSTLPSSSTTIVERMTPTTVLP